MTNNTTRAWLNCIVNFEPQIMSEYLAELHEQRQTYVKMWPRATTTEWQWQKTFPSGERLDDSGPGVGLANALRIFKNIAFKSSKEYVNVFE